MQEEPDHRPVVLYVDDIKSNLMLFEASFNNIYMVRHCFQEVQRL